jgi:feruloyl esterase
MVLLLLGGLLSTASRPCESLAALEVEGGRVTSAVSVPAGDWKDPGGEVHRSLPAFCRAELQLSAGEDSAIRAEVWLPEAWNGRLLGTGNGSYAGEIQYGWLESGVTRAYATVNDDMGSAPSKGFDGSPLVGHPAKWLDFGWRATHLATVAARQVVAARYGKPPHHAYFVGCSQGGRQTLREAQRFPEDFDGVLAGCPAADNDGAIAQVVWEHRALRETPDSLPTAEKGAALKKAVLDACGPTAEGPAGDRWLVDPARCAFDPARIQCRDGDAPDCLTAAQVEAIRKIYQGPVNPRTGVSRYPGMPRGAEAPRYWKFVASQPQPPWSATYQWVFGAGWDVAKLDFDRDQATVDAVLAPILDVSSGDFSGFARRGGKLILWHGWSDQVIPATATLDLFRRLKGDPRGPGGGSASSFARLYLVPGVAHCAGGPGADGFGAVVPGAAAAPDHDMLEALVLWVEKGIAPGRIVATKWVDADDPAKGIVFERPLCPYPSVARYRGTGDRIRAASFECVRPR